MTLLESAKKNKITPLIQKIAALEDIAPEILSQRIAEGRIVIPFSPIHKPKIPCGIGEGLRVKVNANIGTSSGHCDLKSELKKLEAAQQSGADAVMDLSTAGDLAKIRQNIIKNSSLPVGTVPIYEAATLAKAKKKNLRKMTKDDIFEVIERQARDGVDFFTVHSGVTLETVGRLKKEGRLVDIVSRGGAILADWMTYHQKENPLYEYFPRLLDIVRRFDITLSLGDGMRPGSVVDATDRSQVQELIILGELAQQANQAGVQVMIEGPGHVPLNQIEANVVLQKSLCHHAPFYVLGPLVTDVAPGYDHITSAIGGALAAYAGADFLCYVTASEHLRIPSIEDVKEGVIACRIAAHAADLARGNKKAWLWDTNMSRARKKRDWDKQFILALDPHRPKKLRKKSQLKEKDVCSMCAEFCSMKLSDKVV